MYIFNNKSCLKHKTESGDDSIFARERRSSWSGNIESSPISDNFLKVFFFLKMLFFNDTFFYDTFLKDTFF